MFHVGGARSALFNWAVAKHTGGTFILRVEDTDAERNKPEYTDMILRSLAVLGMAASDSTFEGPYFQSANDKLHNQAAIQLYESGKAYYCDCTRDDVVARTGSQHLGYDGFCRVRGLEPGPGRALRFRTPDTGETVVVDLIRGNPTFPNNVLEDFVIARGDGSAVFLLANVVDDIDERVTHVIRGEEHLPNTPKQQLLWEALGQQPPVWAHLPVIVNEKRQKLSKRRDKVSLEDFLADGILPEAMVNYLMLLGWSPGNDEEVLPFDEMVRRFAISDVNSAPSFFDIKKLTAINGDYIRAMSPQEFLSVTLPVVRSDAAPWPAEAFNEAEYQALAPLVQTRIATLNDIYPNVDFLYLPEAPVDQAAWDKAFKDPGAEVLRGVYGALSGLPADDWNAEAIKTIVTEVGEANGLKLGKAQAPIRVATTGRAVGLPLFESLQVLGRDRTLARLKAALETLG
jgi:glutamyl-tRNA synthetase